MECVIEIGINKSTNIRDKKGQSLLWFPNEYIVFDIETTGLDASYDEIIEIGALKIKNNEIVDKFTSLIKPKYPIDEFITELTGITNEMVKDAPLINEVLPRFLDFIGDEILVGHNINFDINFVYDNLIKIGSDKLLSNNYVDTLRLARRILRNLKHHRLSDLAEYYNIDGTGAHRSLKDCEITNQILNLLEEQVLRDYGTIEEFLNSCKKKSSNFKASDIVTTNVEFDEDNMFFDKNVAITGTLEKIVRKDAMQIIVDLGGHCEDRVTQKTNYLILGNNDYNPILRGKKSSKLLKAEQLKLDGCDIEIISENVFYDIISEQIKEKTLVSDVSEKFKIADNTIFNDLELSMYESVKNILLESGRSIDDVRCNLNTNNNFSILLFGQILRTKLRGKKNYIVIENDDYIKYNFSSFTTEPSTSADGGDIRVIIDELFDINMFKEYIIDKYDFVDNGNKEYIANVKCGAKNYRDYLNDCYK